MAELRNVTDQTFAAEVLEPGLPASMDFRNGEVMGRLVGARPKADFVDMIAGLL